MEHIKEDLIKELEKIEKILILLDNFFSIEDKNLNENDYIKLSANFDDLLYKFMKIGEQITDKKMREEGMVHGRMYDILAYYGVITADERDLIYEISDERAYSNKKKLHEILKTHFSFFKSLNERYRQIIIEEF